MLLLKSDMEQFLDLYTTSSKELVYVYTFENGGLANFIKFARTTMNFCWENKLRFSIYIYHPIAKYIVFKYPVMNFTTSITTADAIAKLSSYRRIAKLGPSSDITSSDKMFILPSEIGRAHV